jgi:hypothetical protein
VTPAVYHRLSLCAFCNIPRRRHCAILSTSMYSLTKQIEERRFIRGGGGTHCYEVGSKWEFLSESLFPITGTRCIPTQIELQSYLHAASSNKPDYEIDHIFGYMMRRRPEDKFLLSSNCLPASKAKVSYILQPLPF